MFARKGKRSLALLLTVVMLLSLIPFNAMAYDTGNYTINSKSVENDTNSLTPPTLENGQVWTGKNVSSGADDVFGITLSALGQNYTTTTAGGTQPVNVALVLDASGSMDSSKMTNMISAANALINQLLPATGTGQNKVGVVTFNRTASVYHALSASRFTVSSMSTQNYTNIQAGINVGYTMLKTAKDGGDTATPVMIVLSDGGTWLYRTDYKSIPTSTTSSTWTEDSYGGNGTSNGNGLAAAAYTIIQANYLKTQMPALKIYTVGFDVSSDLLARTTLNPTAANIDAVTGGSSATLRQRLDAIDAADTEYSYGNYFYPESGGAFTSSVSAADLTAAFTQALNDITSNNAPLANGTNLVITDTISNDFVLSGSLTVNLAGTNYTLTNNSGTYASSDPALSGLSVVISGTTLTWTIPASILPSNSFDTSGATPVLVPKAPITLSFNVALGGSATAGTMYYTNYSDGDDYADRLTTPGAASSFTPAGTNPYYVASPASSGVTDSGSDTYTNAAAVEGYWEENGNAGTPTNNLYWESQFTSEKNSITFAYVIIGSVRYEQDSDNTDGETTSITCQKPNGGYKNHWCNAVVTRTHAIEGEDKTVTVSNFWFYPNGGEQTETSNISGYSGATRTITTYAWVAPVAEQTQFTVTPDPDGVGDSVAITAGGHTYNAEVTSFTSSTVWTASMTSTSGSSTTVCTFTLSGNTMTIAYTVTTVTAAVYQNGCVGGVASIAMKSTGKISLRCSTSTLTIKKLVEAYDGSNKGEVGSFAFTVKTGSSAGSLSNYSGAATLYTPTIADPTVYTSSSITITDGALTLSDGQYAVIGSIPVGTYYSVTEANYSAQGYETSVSGNGTTASEDNMAGTGTILQQGNAVTFTNTFYPTATIDITKVISKLFSSVAVPENVTFPFYLYSFNGTSYTKLPDFEASVNTSGTLTTTMDVRMDKIADLIGNDDSVDLYVHEGIMSGDAGTGWTPDAGYYMVTISKDGTVDYGLASDDTVTITNTYIPTSQLTLTKQNPDGNSSDSFNFDIKITVPSDYSYSYTVTGLTDPVTGTGEKTITVSLKNNESAVISGIPVGAAYTVTETDYTSQGYYPTVASGLLTGTVAAASSAVTVLNNYETRDLTVHKAISADGNPNDEFDFTVLVNGSTFTTFSLKGGESKLVEDLPVGAEVTVTETADTAYDTSYGPDLHHLTDGASAIFTMDEESSDDLYFYNSYRTGTLSVTKTVLVDPQEEMTTLEEEAESEDAVKYPVKVTFTGSYLDKIACSLEDFETSTESGKLIFTFELANGETAEFTGIPAGVTYKVEETDSKGADSHAVNYSDDDQVISYNDEDTAVIVNKYLTPATLTISKSVTKSGDSPTQGTFEFEIYFYNMVSYPDVYDETGENIETYGYTEEIGYNLAADEMPAGLTPVAGQDGHYTFTLTQNGSLAFSSLPVGLQFAVWETDDGGARSTSVTKNGTVVTDTTDTEGNDTEYVVVKGTIVQDIPNDDDDKSIAVLFTNDFRMTHGELAVSKTVDDKLNVSSGWFTFEVVITGQPQSSIGLNYNSDELEMFATEDDSPVSYPVTDTGDASDPTDDVTTYKFALKAGAEVSFTGLWDGTEYEVTELFGADELTIPDSTTINSVPDEDRSTDGTMTAESWTVQDVSIAFKNIYNPPTTTTVKDAYDAEENLLSAEGENGIAYAVDGVHKGAPVTYVITVTNSSGNKDLTLEYVEDAMFDNLLAQLGADETTQDVVSVTKNGADALDFSVEPSSSDPIQTARLVLTDGCALAPDDYITIVYTVTFSSFGDKFNKATSHAVYLDSNDFPVESNDDALITVYPDSGVSIGKMVADGSPESHTNFDKRAEVDYLDTVTYQVTVTNTAEADLSISLSDALWNAAATIDSVTLNGTALTEDTDYFVDKAHNKITFRSDFRLAAGDVLVVIYSLAADGAIHNTAYVTASDTRDELSEYSSADVTIKTPSISVDKTVDPTWALTGDIVSYKVEITNDYELPMDLVSIKDSLFAVAPDADEDGNPDYAMTDIAVTCGENTLAFSLNTATGTLSFNTAGEGETLKYPSIPSGGTAILTYTVKFFKADTYYNTASATMSYNGKTASATDTASVQIADPSVGILVTKLVNGASSVSVTSGSTVTYTATIKNTSNVDLTQVQFTDPVFELSDFSLVSVVKTLGEDTTTLTDEGENPQYGLSGTVLSISDEVGFEVDAVITVTYTLKLTSSYTNTVEGSAYYDSNDDIQNDPITAEASAHVTVTTPYDPPSNNDTYYKVTVNYYDQDGNKIAPTYVTSSAIAGSSYDVTDQTALGIDGYTYDRTTGSPASGTLNSNKIVNVYYTKDEEPPIDIPDEEPPLGEPPVTEEPPVEIEEPEVPLGNLPQTGTAAAPVNPVWTLGMLALSLSMAAAGLTVTFGRKKDEEQK